MKKRKSKANSPGIRIKKWLFLLFIALSLFLGFKLFQAWQNQVWIPNTRLTVVVATDNPTIYSYNPQTGSLLKIQVPANTQIETAFEYGKWPAGSLWDLGVQKGKDGDILKESLQKAFGLPIDGWFSKDTGNVLQVRSSLSFFDHLRVLSILSSTTAGAVREIDLLITGVIQKTNTQDGLEGFVVLPSRAQTTFELLRDDTVLKERKTIIVVNSTERDGLAEETGRLLSTLGLRVVSTDTLKENVAERCILVGSKENLSSISAQKILNLLDCEKRQKDPSRPSNLELILGSKYP